MDIKKELRLLKEEKLRRLQMLHYQKNPVDWLEERFGESRKNVDWELWGGDYKNHVWDGSISPFKYAWQALADGNKKVGIESATGTGKTHWLARVVFWFLDCFENSFVVTSAPVAGQLKTQLWSEMKSSFHKFKKIRPYAELFDSLRLLVDARGFDNLEDDEANQNAWQAVGVASRASSGSKSNTSRQGFHREHMLIITEETPGIDLASMEAYINTSTGEHNLILAVGNPDAQTDTLHNFCKKPNTKHFIISAYDHPNIVLQKELIPGAATIGSIEDRKEEYGEESAFYKSRVRGISPAQSIDSLIKAEWIKQCINLDIEKDNSKNAVGVDVANSINGDKACVAYGESNVVNFIKEFNCPDASHLAYNLILPLDELMNEGYHIFDIPNIKTKGIKGEYIGVDSVGIGTSTINTLHNKKIFAQALSGGQNELAIPKDKDEKPLYQFASLRSQMYWEAREDLRNKKISIKLEDKRLIERLITELVEPKYTVTDKTISVEKKEIIKQRLGGKSPNIADSFVYWNWARKGYFVKKAAFLPFG
ncbi:MAG: hypothetical protein MUC49_15695 [Raineya sp.]|jgi:hypothetical protein|nr:hypothetical protein [Raineya sp.]